MVELAPQPATPLLLDWLAEPALAVRDRRGRLFPGPYVLEKDGGAWRLQRRSERPLPDARAASIRIASVDAAAAAAAAATAAAAAAAADLSDDERNVPAPSRFPEVDIEQTAITTMQILGAKLSSKPQRFGGEVGEFKRWKSSFENFTAGLHQKAIFWLQAEIGRASCRERVCQYV